MDTQYRWDSPEIPTPEEKFTDLINSAVQLENLELDIGRRQIGQGGTIADLPDGGQYMAKERPWVEDQILSNLYLPKLRAFKINDLLVTREPFVSFMLNHRATLSRISFGETFMYSNPDRFNEKLPSEWEVAIK